MVDTLPVSIFRIELVVLLLLALLGVIVFLILKLQAKDRQFKAEQARFQSSINSINVGFMVTDSAPEILNVNTAAKQILFGSHVPGVPSILRESPSNFNFTIQEIDRRLNGAFSLQDSLRQCLTDKTTITRDFAFDNLYLHLFMTPIVVLEGRSGLELEIIGTVVLIEDVTQETILERSKEEFFSIASHELRTPLTAIRGNIAMIKDLFRGQIREPVMKEMIEDIYASSIRLINIVNDFLDASRLEQGRIQYKRASFNVAELTREAVRELTPLASQKGIFLESDNPGNLPQVLADRERVKQVIINLIGNALKFTAKGGIRVSFSLEAGMVKVSVADTGLGIPPENQRLLFHKFQQAGNNILTRDVGGTGLGLYISKLMVEALGGKIFLERSEPGLGSVFSFTLPPAGPIRTTDPQIRFRPQS